MHFLRNNTVGVCFLLEDFYPVIHGSTRQVMMLGKRLAEKKIGVIVVTRRIYSENPKEEEIDGYKIYRVPPVCKLSRMGKFYMVIPALWTLFKKRDEYQIILVSDFKVLGVIAVIASKLLGKKCILRGSCCGELDGSYAFAYDESPGVVKKIVVKVFVTLRNLILKKSDLFLSVSSPITKELISSNISEEKIFELINGVDTNIFKPVDVQQKKEIRKRLKLPDSIIFTYTGRIAKGKGLFGLIKVWERVVSNHNDVHLLFVGSGQGFALSCEDEIRESVRIKNLGEKVTFTGHVENVHEYLQASDYYIFPTEYEAASNSLIEATSTGLPSIATRVGGVVDIITHNVNGLLVEDGDLEQLFRSIEDLLTDENMARRLSEQAREVAVQKLNIDKNVDSLEELFASLAALRGGDFA